ncbi:hypothetical protein DFH06DRAFT_528827 [Mycena polygramma]|nr:hypothetical protein DFH06DRAFT_528827 [Mycena polygramma]
MHWAQRPGSPLSPTPIHLSTTEDVHIRSDSAHGERNNWQIQPLIKDKTICFDCIPKPTPKIFPVRTIRLTASLPWQYSMRQLSGAIELTRSSMRRRNRYSTPASVICSLCPGVRAPPVPLKSDVIFQESLSWRCAERAFDKSIASP